jgi:hypothetical protein
MSASFQVSRAFDDHRIAAVFRGRGDTRPAVPAEARRVAGPFAAELAEGDVVLPEDDLDIEVESGTDDKAE